MINEIIEKLDDITSKEITLTYQEAEALYNYIMDLNKIVDNQAVVIKKLTYKGGNND